MSTTQTEAHRHQCEVRTVLRWRQNNGRGWIDAWLDGVKKARGAEAADRLREDAAGQWGKGNRGDAGDWR